MESRCSKLFIQGDNNIYYWTGQRRQLYNTVNALTITNSFLMVEPWLIYFIWWDLSLSNNDIKGTLQTKRKITEGLLADVEFSPKFQWQLGLSWTQAGEFKAVNELPATLDRRHLHSESESWLSAWLESESTKRHTAGWVLDSVPSRD